MSAPSSTAGLATLRAGLTYRSRTTVATLTRQAIDAAALARIQREAGFDLLASATEHAARSAAECATRRISSAAGLASIRGGLR